MTLLDHIARGSLVITHCSHERDLFNMNGVRVPTPNRVLGMNGEQYVFYGSFVDNVKKYPRDEDWIEMVI